MSHAFQTSIRIRKVRILGNLVLADMLQKIKLNSRVSARTDWATVPPEVEPHSGC
jgi:hypothetical protein